MILRSRYLSHAITFPMHPDPTPLYNHVDDYHVAATGLPLEWKNKLLKLITGKHALYTRYTYTPFPLWTYNLTDLFQSLELPLSPSKFKVLVTAHSHQLYRHITIQILIKCFRTFRICNEPKMVKVISEFPEVHRSSSLLCSWTIFAELVMNRVTQMKIWSPMLETENPNKLFLHWEEYELNLANYKLVPLYFFNSFAKVSTQTSLLPYLYVQLKVSYYLLLV